MLQLPQSDMSIKSDHVVNSVCTKTLPPTSATSRRRTSPGNKAVDVGLRTHAVSTRLENRQFLTCTTILHQSGKDEGQRHATWSLPEIDTAVIPARLPSLGELTITMELVLPPHGWTKTRRLRGMQCTTILDQSGKDEGQRHATWSLPENDAASPSLNRIRPRFGRNIARIACEFQRHGSNAIIRDSGLNTEKKNTLFDETKSYISPAS